MERYLGVYVSALVEEKKQHQVVSAVVLKEAQPRCWPLKLQ